MYIVNRRIVLNAFLLAAVTSVNASNVANDGRGADRDLISFGAFADLLAQPPPPVLTPPAEPGAPVLPPTQTGAPSGSSSPSISGAPTEKPSATPSATPSLQPTSAPSANPSISIKPSAFGPTPSPSRTPTSVPSSRPSVVQSKSPTNLPTNTPSRNPTDTPSNVPSRSPSKMPTKVPSLVPTHFPSPEPSQNPTQTPTTCSDPVNCLRFQTSGNTGFFAIDKCAASCDFDVQCKQGLVCYKRNRGQKSVPGCIGDADEIGNGDFNFCIKPPSNQLVILGFQGSPSNVYPLGRCAGDCDTDADCGNGLFCFERNGSENVPGCIGSGQPQFDYCYNPGSNFQRLAFFGDIEYDYYELGQCEGDCDFDADCDIGLVCFQREANDSGKVPSCIGNANTVGTGSDDFCIPRPSANTLISVYDNIEGGDVAGGGQYPIPSCAGDCDIDADCQGSLTCFFRAGFDDVPGCSGFGDDDYDYCI